MSRIYSSTIDGISGVPIEIETALEQSLPQIHITGLPGPSVKESRDRVRAALQSLGFEVPSQKTVIHLSPAEFKKQGSQFDLAIAIGVLLAEQKVRLPGDHSLAFLGELTLDGRIKKVQFGLSLTQCFDSLTDVQWIIAPEGNAGELGLLPSSRIKLASTLGEVVNFLRGEGDLRSPDARSFGHPSKASPYTFDEIIGHSVAKRAVQIAVAGRHHLLLSGPPGVGKSLLAKSAENLLPPLEIAEQVEVVKNHAWHDIPSVFGRPFRAPHHSISTQALLGGGNGNIAPGEATLADLGVLFLDEFPEFHRDAIEGLREPLEDRTIQIHRVGKALKLPARFTLIASMNPCPCGYHKVQGAQRCHCPQERIARYRKKMSGPILDRMDLFVSVTRALKSVSTEPSHADAMTSVLRAWKRQSTRYENALERNGTQKVNVDNEPFLLRSRERSWYEGQVHEARLSLRALHKILRVARTIADIEDSDLITEPHLMEAIALRCPHQLLQP